MGLPPDRAPREEDWAWLNALAGHPEPGTEKRVLRETQLLAEALKEALGGQEPPREEMRAGLLSGWNDDLNDAGEMADLGDLDARFLSSSSLSAQEFEAFSRDDEMDSLQASYSSSYASASASYEKPGRAGSDDRGIFPEPSGNGFARLRRRLREAGLL